MYVKKGENIMFSEIREVKSSEVRKKNDIEEERRRLFMRMIDCRIGSEEFEQARQALSKFEDDNNIQ